MLRLRKYLKPYLLLILITIVLLFVQANADLALPDYLSRIVNNGIQQGGVENAVPVAIRQSQMDKLLTFVSCGRQGVWCWIAIAWSSRDLPRQSSTSSKYPGLAEAPIYVLQEVDQAKMDSLNSIMGKAWVVVSGIEQMMANPAKAAAMGQGLGLDLSKIPAGVDLFALLATMPAEQLAQIRSGDRRSDLPPWATAWSPKWQSARSRPNIEALGMDTTRLQRDYILRIGGLMLLISLLGGACTIAVGYLAAKTAAGAARDIRRAAFAKVESFSSAEFDKFSTASLITRSTNDVTQVQMVIFMIMRMVFYAPIIGVGGVIRAIGKSANMWWIIAVAVVALLGLILVVFSISLPKFKIMQSLIDRLNLVMRENLSGMMVIRAFNKQGDEAERFDKANRDLTSTSLFVARVMVTMMPVMMLIMNGLSLLHHLGGRPPGRRVDHAGGRYDGVYAIRHADRLCLLDDVDDVHLFAQGGGIRRPDCGRARNRACHHRSRGAAAVQGAVQRRDRVPAMSLSAIPTRWTMCSTTSALRPGPEKPQPLSALRARANRPSST